jgi:hypothetical protein
VKVFIFSLANAFQRGLLNHNWRVVEVVAHIWLVVEVLFIDGETNMLSILLYKVSKANASKKMCLVWWARSQCQVLPLVVC